MATDDDAVTGDAVTADDAVTAWWLGLAPSRQEELLMTSPPPMPWLDESLRREGIDRAAIDRFVRAKRQELEPTRDAGLNPRPE